MNQFILSEVASSPRLVLRAKAKPVRNPIELVSSLFFPTKALEKCIRCLKVLWSNIRSWVYYFMLYHTDDVGYVGTSRPDIPFFIKLCRRKNILLSSFLIFSFQIFLCMYVGMSLVEGTMKVLVGGSGDFLCYLDVCQVDEYSRDENDNCLSLLFRYKFMHAEC